MKYFHRFLSGFCTCALLCVGAGLARAQGATNQQVVSPDRGLTVEGPAFSMVRPLVEEYCVTCHGEQTQTAGINIKIGRFLDLLEPTDLSDLHLALLQRSGVLIDTFGHSTMPLHELDT